MHAQQRVSQNVFNAKHANNLNSDNQEQQSKPETQDHDAKRELLTGAAERPLKYLNFNELRSKLGNRGRTSIYRDIDVGRLPKPVKFGARLYWIEAEIDAIMNKLADAA